MENNKNTDIPKDTDIPVVGVNSVRWLCPKCCNANAACPNALGQNFFCEKCGTMAKVVFSKQEYLKSLTK